jgi:hypothetical protein
MRHRRHDVIVISHTSIIVPFLLGTALALYLYPRIADQTSRSAGSHCSSAFR